MLICIQTQRTEIMKTFNNEIFALLQNNQSTYFQYLKQVLEKSDKFYITSYKEVLELELPDGWEIKKIKESKFSTHTIFIDSKVRGEIYLEELGEEPEEFRVNRTLFKVMFDFFRIPIMDDRMCEYEYLSFRAESVYFEEENSLLYPDHCTEEDLDWYKEFKKRISEKYSYPFGESRTLEQGIQIFNNLVDVNRATDVFITGHHY